MCVEHVDDESWDESRCDAKGGEIYGKKKRKRKIGIVLFEI